MICRDCEGFFTETTRCGQAVCRFHDGGPPSPPFLSEQRLTIVTTDLLIPDDDSGYWDDHDEDCHGIIDTEDMKADQPRGLQVAVLRQGEWIRGL